MNEVWTVLVDRNRVGKEPFLIGIATTEEKANAMRDKLKEEWSTLVDEADMESLLKEVAKEPLSGDVATMVEKANVLRDDVKEGFECHIAPMKLDTLLGTDF